MGPLVKRAKPHASWSCWEALVACMSYSVRHSYDAEEGPKEFDRLADELLDKFDKVEEWAGYEKPKLHPPKHLGEQLKDFGPPRTIW